MNVDATSKAKDNDLRDSVSRLILKAEHPDDETTLSALFHVLKFGGRIEIYQSETNYRLSKTVESKMIVRIDGGVITLPKDDSL
jgi:hypothetical protein